MPLCLGGHKPPTGQPGSSRPGVAERHTGLIWPLSAQADTSQPGSSNCAMAGRYVRAHVIPLDSGGHKPPAWQLGSLRPWLDRRHPGPISCHSMQVASSHPQTVLCPHDLGWQEDIQGPTWHQTVGSNMLSKYMVDKEVNGSYAVGTRQDRSEGDKL